MLTPPMYWRIACALDGDFPFPPDRYSPPENLAKQSSPPKTGDGLVLAAYDIEEQTGLIKYLGLVTSGRGELLTVDWKPVEAQIWVDTPTGRGFWKNKPGFGFAETKVAGYGLHALFAENFEGMEIREHLPAGTRSPTQPKPPRPQSIPGIAPERLNPIEVIGEPSTGARCGVVYLLRSAFGYKVGRTRNVPARMRAFGVHLPFIYTIPLCAWFDDCVVAEKGYHDMFRDKRINGEWFDLNDSDIEQIRTKAVA